jgi:serine/threonine protein kinase
MDDHFVSRPEDAGDERPLGLGSYRGKVRAAYDDPVFLEAIRRPEELWSHPGARILATKRNRLGIFRLPLSGGPSKDIVVKEFSSRGVNRLKSLFLPSKAAKAWRGAMALEQRGLKTASAVAYFEKRRQGFVEQSFFLAERIDEAVEIRDLFRSLSLLELDGLLSALAGYLSLCHQKSVLHRDLSDGNVLVKRDEKGDFVFYLLDTNRVCLHRKISRPARVKNLIRLGIPAPLQRPFLKKYFGENPLGTASWVWYRISKSVYTGYVGLKKKLRLRQLARKLGVQ